MEISQLSFKHCSLSDKDFDHNLSRNCCLHRFCKLYTYYLGSIAIPYNKPMHFELWLIEIPDAYDNLL